MKHIENMDGTQFLHSAPSLDIPPKPEISPKPMKRLIPDSNGSFLDILSTHFLICNEKIEGKGEDSGYESYTSQTGIIAVFDGCGGLGSKTCSSFSDKTEAYLASRSICNAVRVWFEQSSAMDEGWDSHSLRDYIVANLQICQQFAGKQEVKFKGSMIRPFPSTLGMVCFNFEESKLVSSHFWAGDSRTYLLDSKGLAQISEDDIKNQDAMSNLMQDGALTNVISADNKFVIHEQRLLLDEACIVFAASDGCFGYVSSPMEFEFILLDTLVNSLNVDEWEGKLNSEISKRAGDDQTIALAVFGFDEFSDMKDYYKPRYNEVLHLVGDFEKATDEAKQNVWENYKSNYYRYNANRV